jgi:hypothetical protein
MDMSDTQKGTLTSQLFTELDLGTNPTYWPTDLEVLAKESVTRGRWDIWVWTQELLGDDTQCSRRHALVRLDNKVEVTFVDCGLRRCAYCRSVLASELTDTHVKGFRTLLGSDDTVGLYIVPTSTKTETASVLRLINRKGAAGLRIPVEDGGDFCWVVTTLEFAAGTYVPPNQFGDTLPDVLYDMLRQVPVGSRVKPNRVLAEAIATAEASTPVDTDPLAVDDLKGPLGCSLSDKAPWVNLRRPTHQRLVEGRIITGSTRHKWTGECSNHQLKLLTVLNEPAFTRGKVLK